MIVYFLLSKLPLSTVYIVSNIGPIFIFIWSYFLLGNNLGLKEIAATMISFIGLVVVV
jgi:drug/metabolite transporter (DMT)-like permease